MLDASDVLVVLDQLDQAGLVAWLDSGWGVDALLGHQRRPHQDLDLVIARDDCAAAEAALAGLGFQPDLAAVPGWPAQLLLVDADGRGVDLHVVVFDRDGNGWQELGGGAWGGYPAEGLTGVGVVGGPAGALPDPTAAGPSSPWLPAGRQRPLRPGAARRAVRGGGATGHPASGRRPPAPELTFNSVLREALLACCALAVR